MTTIKELRELEAKATKGPWSTAGEEWGSAHRRDIAARNALPALLDIAEKASEAVEAGAVDEIYLTLLRDALARLAEAK